MSLPIVSGQVRRLDIQILRGYAVLLVVLYHAGLHLLPGGYVGVDIFFVISGYLITGIIRRDLSQGTFSLTAFYIRRAKRLFPAAYVTFFVTALLSPFLLTSSELYDFGRQLIGALTFSANYVLKTQTGYFDGAADLKPLLHTWSLSVEEQFYFVIPTLLLIIPQRVHFAFFLILFTLSLGGCFFAKANPETIFYTLPYRAWELALGALVALYPASQKGHVPQWRMIVLMPWLVLGLVPLMPFARLHPTLSSLAACLATVLLLFTSPALKKTWINRRMAAIGDLSYAWYLVHWPLFAFFSNLLIQKDHLVPWIRAGLIPLSLFLALILHHRVERPFLKSPSKGYKVAVGSLCGAAFLIGFFSLEARFFPTPETWKAFRSPSMGLNKACVAAGPMNFAQCRNASSSHYLVWGDSMAMHLINGLASSRIPDVPLIQATRHACAPLMGIADYRNKSDQRFQWEASCIRFNDEVLEGLRRDKTLRTVVLAGNFTTFLNPDRHLVYRSSEDGTLKEDSSQPERVYQSLKLTVDGVRASGLKVVIVAPPPKAAFDVSRCLERRMRSLLTYGGDPECRIEPRAMEPEFRLFNLFISRLKSELKIDTLTFDSTLCDGLMCNTVYKGIPLYRDDAHFSVEGGGALIRDMKLMDQVDQLAR
jgi:peptidoglycan/LPS O-acetylase OafA/YrhL